MVSTLAKVCALVVSIMLSITVAEIPNESLHNKVVIDLDLVYNPSPILKSDEDMCIENVQCRILAEAVFFESRGEPTKGQYAVAFVVRNRRDNERRWGDTIAKVVNSKRDGVCQFSYVCQLDRATMNRMMNRSYDAWVKSLQVAYNVYYFVVDDWTQGADHFYNPAKVKRTPRFAQVYEYVAHVGGHKIFKSN